MKIYQLLIFHTGAILIIPYFLLLVTRNGGNHIAAEVPQPDGALDRSGGYESVVVLEFLAHRDRRDRPRMRSKTVRNQ